MANSNDKLDKVLIHQEGFLKQLGSNFMSDPNIKTGCISQVNSVKTVKLKKDDILSFFISNCFAISGVLLVYSLVGSLVSGY